MIYVVLSMVGLIIVSTIYSYIKGFFQNIKKIKVANEELTQKLKLTEDNLSEEKLLANKTPNQQN